MKRELAITRAISLIAIFIAGIDTRFDPRIRARKAAADVSASPSTVSSSHAR
jgi:hypothetical protein